MTHAKHHALPTSVRRCLPAHAQSIYRQAFDHAYAAQPDEARAHRLAWAAVGRSYEQVNGAWVPRDRDW